MKKTTLTLLAAFAVAGTSFAGTTVTSKEYKQPVVVTPCFRDTEFAVDLFYSYNNAVHNKGGNNFDGNTSDNNGTFGFNGFNQNRYFRDGSGGGVAVDYFFARYFGISVEGNWWVGVNNNTVEGVAFQNAAGGTTVVATNGATVGAVTTANGTVTGAGTTTVNNRNESDFHDVAHQVTGSLIFRYPFEGSFCWAPYVFGGGGGIWDGRSSGFGHMGLGAEWRMTPNFGLFADWRWEFIANRNDVNTTRAGIRFVF